MKVEVAFFILCSATNKAGPTRQILGHTIYTTQLQPRRMSTKRTRNEEFRFTSEKTGQTYSFQELREKIISERPDLFPQEEEKEKKEEKEVNAPRRSARLHKPASKSF